MKRTEGYDWQYPKNANDSIQNLLEGLFWVECGLNRTPSAKGISKQYLEHIKFLIERALKYRDSNSSYARTEQVKTSVRSKQRNHGRIPPKSETYYENHGWAPKIAWDAF